MKKELIVKNKNEETYKLIFEEFYSSSYNKKIKICTIKKQRKNGVFYKIRICNYTNELEIIKEYNI